MTDADKVEFNKIFAVYAEIYNKELNKDFMRIYFALLSEFTIEQVRLALENHAKSTDGSGAFFPKPSDIISKIKGTQKQQQQAIEDRAEIAWHVIESEIRRIGAYCSLKIEDKQAIAAVKAIGGWRDLCGSTIDQMAWKKKEFIKAYETYDRTPLEQLPSKLAGIIELAEAKKQSKQQLQSIADGVKRLIIKG